MTTETDRIAYKSSVPEALDLSTKMLHRPLKSAAVERHRDIGKILLATTRGTDGIVMMAGLLSLEVVGFADAMLDRGTLSSNTEALDAVREVHALIKALDQALDKAFALPVAKETLDA